jgi:hypothetical protein
MAKNYQGKSPDAAPGPAPRTPSSETISREVTKSRELREAKNKPHYERSPKERRLAKKG